MLEHSPDPRRRSHLVHRFRPLGVDPALLAERLEHEPNVSIRRALILSLGPEEFPEETWVPNSKRLVVQRLKEIYATEDDPGMHAAAEWLLHQWREEEWLNQTVASWTGDKDFQARRLQGITGILQRQKEKAKPQWYVNGQGQTLIVLPGPVEFAMGSPDTEAFRRPDEALHTCRIGRSFAIMAGPVTKEQFLRFDPGYTNVEMRRYPEPGCPIGGLWAQHCCDYCNWLSRQEGISPDQWCYEMNNQGETTKLKPNYLSLSGYRLPTEPEFEYDCRAGAATARFYGQSEELLGKYACKNLLNSSRTHLAGGQQEAERLRIIRHARPRLHLVPAAIRGILDERGGR